jgi:putative spermidine/putrescine transport system ATP-binding protein
MTSASAALSIEGLTKRFGSNAAAVDDLRLDVRAGQMMGLLGPSGCGKTTVLRAIAGLTPVDAGVVRVGGIDITALPPHRRDVGMVFQSYALFPHLSVADNIAFGLEMRRLDRAEIRARVDETLQLVRLPGYGERRPRELSGGQQQRVALARALAIQPRILLLDEPLSNLDARLRDELRVEIREIQQRLAITTVFVTHDQIEALTMCDAVGVMRSGRIAQLGTPEDIYERPRSRFVAEFVGRVNTIACEVIDPEHVRVTGHELACAAHQLAPGPAVATIRPHRIRLVGRGAGGAGENAPSRVAGRISRITYIGDVIQYEIACNGLFVKVETHPDRSRDSRSVGDEVVCEWSPDDLLVFQDPRDSMTK